jgi:transglutaminase-like putative cysteine protease
MAPYDTPAAAGADVWGLETTRRMVHMLRPYLGWSIFLTVMLLTLFPALGLDLIAGRTLRRTPELAAVGPLAVMATWFVLGWRRPRFDASRRRTILAVLQACFAGLLLCGLGVLAVSQLLRHWIPGPQALWLTTRSNNWPLLVQRVQGDWTSLINQYVLWGQGVASGGANQDDLVFAGFAGLGFWLLGMLSAGLARRTRRGLLAAAPVLGVLSFTLLYTDEGRWLFVGSLATAILLHLLLDQAGLLGRWEAYGLDFNPTLGVDRAVVTVFVSLSLLAFTVLIPAIGSNRIAWWYYQQMQPVNERFEELSERMFPDLQARGGIFGYGIAGGLPNEFLVTTDAAERTAEVMQVRTNEYGDFDRAPPGHYMRSGTFSDYDGRGWDNPTNLERVEERAGEAWIEDVGAARKPLVQTVTLAFNGRVVYAAGEPVMPSVEYRSVLRAPGDLAYLSAPTRSYSVTSLIPAASDAALAATEGWSAARPLPTTYAHHLSLPDTVTPRTRALAETITADAPTLHAKAQAIEQYLRGFEYDLSVPLPSDEIADITDYFLFELERGYCDYYATAFVVLARSVGIPARFASGFAVGSWDPTRMSFLITEGEAHSWPEVYFPEYGWIPFEPTAGRPELVRPVDLPDSRGAPVAAPAPQPGEEAATAIDWNWQMLVWLLPLGLLLWGGVQLVQRLRRRREDPWAATLRWGERAGRPMGEGETALEYGRKLGTTILAQAAAPDSGRVAAREVAALSRDVSDVRYGREAQRTAALARVHARWQSLREYLRLVR